MRLKCISLNKFKTKFLLVVDVVKSHSEEGRHKKFGLWFQWIGSRWQTCVNITMLVLKTKSWNEEQTIILSAWLRRLSSGGILARVCC